MSGQQCPHCGALPTDFTYCDHCAATNVHTKPTRSEHEPHDRLTRVGDAMLAALVEHPEATGHEQAIVVLADPSTERNATAFRGFDDDLDAAFVLFEHMRAIFRAHGREVMLAPLGGEG